MIIKESLSSFVTAPINCIVPFNNYFKRVLRTRSMKKSLDAHKKALVNSSFNCDIEAIDSISNLLIDISTLISKSTKGYNNNVEELDIIKLLENIKNSELIRISESLYAWNNAQNILAPSYMPSEKESKALFSFIYYKLPISKGVYSQIIENKAYCTNFQSFILSGKLSYTDKSTPKLLTNQFLNDLKSGLSELEKDFDQIGFKKAEKKIFYTFISKSASILFYLGFADAINHSVQVSRKCILDAYRRKSSIDQILQSAIVGWIHDPKLPGTFSWNNLSTHPVIASAIAMDVLTQPDLRKLIETYFKINGNTFSSADEFVKGAVEAVAINNDSKFVLDNAIFERPTWAPGIQESGGVLDQVKEILSKKLGTLKNSNIAGEIKEIALDRFYSPSEERVPASFDSALISILESVQVETGLLGIKLAPFNFAKENLKDKYEIMDQYSTKKLFDDIMIGKLNNAELIKDIYEYITKQDNTFEAVKVNAIKLFCHHDEMKFGANSALNLAVADRLLLSPQKIIEAGVQNTVLGRIKSFIESFEDNISTLPKFSHNGGKIFQRDLYFSILQAADKLTGNKNSDKFNMTLVSTSEKYLPFKSSSLKDLDISNIETQVNYLKHLINANTTWISSTSEIDYGNINPKEAETKELLTMLLNIISEEYSNMLEQSPEMFSIKVKKSLFTLKSIFFGL